MSNPRLTFRAKARLRQKAEIAGNLPRAEVYAILDALDYMDRLFAACGCPPRICLICAASEPCQTEPDGNGDGPACTWDATYPQLVTMLHEAQDKLREAQENYDDLKKRWDYVMADVCLDGLDEEMEGAESE